MQFVTKLTEVIRGLLVILIILLVQAKSNPAVHAQATFFDRNAMIAWARSNNCDCETQGVIPRADGRYCATLLARAIGAGGFGSQPGWDMNWDGNDDITNWFSNGHMDLIEFVPPDQADFILYSTIPGLTAANFNDFVWTHSAIHLGGGLVASWNPEAIDKPINWFIGMQSILGVRIRTTPQSPPVITSISSVSVVANTSFSHTFNAIGEPTPTLSYSNENLPSGVTRSGDTLSGIPSAVGTYMIDVTASNGIAPDATQTFTITVTGDAPAITSASSANVAAGSPLNHTFTAIGNPAPTLNYSNENLPPGVTRSGNTLSGIPTAAGTYNITVVASNGVAPDAVQNFVIIVTGDAPIITSVSSLNTMEQSSLNHTFTAIGNPAPTLNYSNENLPPGVTRSGNTLSGIPTAAGTYNITVVASNGVAPDAVQNFVIIVGALPMPPPALHAEDVNFDNNSVVRTGIPESLVDSINIRELYQNGTPTQWLGGALYNAGSIGNLGVLNLGVQQAIDIFSPNGMTYFNGGAVFCLRGEGTLIWMAARNAPRTAEIIGSYTVDDYPGYTCATLFEPGMLILVNGLTTNDH